MTGGVPYSLTVPNLPILDNMSLEEFDAMMEKGYADAIGNKGISIEDNR